MDGRRLPSHTFLSHTFCSGIEQRDFWAQLKRASSCLYPSKILIILNDVFLCENCENSGYVMIPFPSRQASIAVKYFSVDPKQENLASNPADGS